MSGQWIKFCGLTRLEDVEAAVALGVQALGVNFWRGSSRYVAPARAAELLAAVPDPVERIGVFVDEETTRIEEIADRCALTAVQLHGAEVPEQVLALAPRRVIKAIRVGSAFDAAILADYACDTFLADADHPSSPGGTGRRADWSRVRELAGGFRIVLAGGLDPANVGEAIRATKPFGVDVASGIESGPGIKQRRKMEAFVAAVRRQAGGER